MTPPRSLDSLGAETLEKLRQRFTAKVEVVDDHWAWCARGRAVTADKGCWFRLPVRLWKLPLNSTRVAWMLFRGTIEEGHSVFRTCGRAGCVRPEHLVTARPEDVWSHLPQPTSLRGEAVAKVATEVEVRAVLEGWNAGKTARELAPLVPRASLALVTAICCGNAWTHVLPRPLPRGTLRRKVLSALRAGPLTVEQLSRLGVSLGDPPLATVLDVLTRGGFVTLAAPGCYQLAQGKGLGRGTA